MTRFGNRIAVLILLSSLLALIACKDEDNSNAIPSDPDPDPPEFQVPETADIVMYEVNIRAFGPGSDFEAVINRLSEIEKLHVNVIWLMPVHPIGEINSVNSPYSVKNYYEVNPEFGDEAKFKSLITEAHNRNMAVIIDWVDNHTAWDNPWIDNEDWYTQDGSGNIIHPPGTNWMDVADLNYESQEMRSAMIDAMQYWVDEMGVDGFRCDAADFVPFDFWEQAIEALDNATDRHLIFLAEGARKDHFTAGFHMTYAWDFYGQLKSVFAGNAQPKMLHVFHQSEYAGLPDWARKLRFTTNHDESAWDETPISLFNGVDGALAASAVSIFMGGVPLLYGSQEVGIEDNIPFFSSSTIDWTQNPGMLSEYQGMLKLFNESNPSKQTGVYLVEHSKILTFMKFSAEARMLCLVNTANNASSINLPDSLANTSWTDGMTGAAFDLPAQVELAPYQYLLLHDPGK